MFLAIQRVVVKITAHEKQNEQLKGVSRVDSLKKIIEWTGAIVSDEEFQTLMVEKNEWYLGVKGITSFFFGSLTGTSGPY